MPGCPTLASLRRDGVRGTMFVHELSQVRPGAALDYLAAMREEDPHANADAIEHLEHMQAFYSLMENFYARFSEAWAEAKAAM